MSTGRYFLTGAVILGSAIYYDQNVQPIFPDWVRQKEVEIPHRLHQEQQRFSLDISSKYNKDVKPRIETFGSQVSAKTSALKDEVVDKAQSVTDRFKQSKVYKDTDDYLNKVDAEAKRLAEPDEDKSYMRQAMIGYIDWVNKIATGKDYVMQEEYVIIDEPQGQSWSLYLYDKSGLHYASNKVAQLFGESKSEAELKGEQLNARLKDLGDDAKRTGDKVAKEANAKYYEAKLAVSDLYEDAKKNVNKKLDKASAAAEAQKQKAIDDYYRSKKDLDDVMAKGDAAKARDVEAAKQKLNLAYASLRLFGDNVIKEANDKLDKLK